MQAEGRRFDPDRLHQALRLVSSGRFEGFLSSRKKTRFAGRADARSACSDDKVKRRRVLRDRVKRAPFVVLSWMRFRLEQRAAGFIALRVDTGVPAGGWILGNGYATRRD